MSYANARRTYMADAVQTVPPGQLLVMLYDALVRNMDLAVAALGRRDLPAAHTGMVKAQDIVSELAFSLDANAWDGAQGLAQLYQYVGAELVTANVEKDADRVTRCRDLVAPLAEAWRDAASQMTAESAQHLVPSSA